MSGANSRWLLTTVNAVRELMLGRLKNGSLDAASQRDVQMALEELDVMWEELQGQAEILARENQRHAEFFEYAPDAYLVTDAGGNIREANRAAADLLRAGRDTLVHRPLSAFVAEADRVAFLSHSVGMIMDKADKASWEAQIRPADGEPVRVLFSVRTIPLGRSGVGGLCWLIRPLA